MVVVAEPDGWVVTLKAELEATPEEQEYVSERVDPTSATSGSQLSSALTVEVAVSGIHCHAVIHAPLYAALHEPTVQLAGFGCDGWF